MKSLLVIKNNFRFKLKFRARIQKLRHSFLLFLLYDRNFLAEGSLQTDSKFLIFKGVFFSLIAEKWLRLVTSKKDLLVVDTAGGGLSNPPLLNFFELLFQINFLAIGVVENKLDFFEEFDDFLGRITESLIYQILNFTCTNLYDAKLVRLGMVEFLSSRVKYLSAVSNLSATRFISFIVYAMFDYIKFLKKQENPVNAGDRTTYLINIGKKKFSGLRLRAIFGAPDYAVGVESGAQVGLRNFFANYAKIKT